MTSKEYRLIGDEDNINEVYTLLHDENVGFGNKNRFFNGFVFITLALSLAANALFTTFSFSHRPHEISSNRTAFGRVVLDTRIVQLINH